MMALHVRLAQASDGQACAAVYDPIVADSAISFETEPPGAAEMSRRIGEVTQRLPWLVAELDGAFAGYAYASRHRERAAYRWAVDVALYVGENCRRRGVAAALYRALFDLLERAHYRRAYAGVTLPNEASIGLHRGLGFETIGTYRRVGYKLGAWHDVTWLGRSLGDDRAPPREPLAFRELLGHEPGRARQVARPAAGCQAGGMLEQAEVAIAPEP
jgi:phosphinothricin acetyltransferase